MCMTTKTISIMDDAYRLLRARKRENESFSEVIRRVFENKKDIMEFAGSLSNLSDEEVDDIKMIIENLKKKSGKELMELK